MTIDKTAKNKYGVLTYKLQEALVALGYSVGSTGVDGKMGPSTESAIRKFQKDTGLDVDGVCGPKTAAKLAEKLGAIDNSLESYFNKGNFKKNSVSQKDAKDVADGDGVGKFQEKVKDFFKSYWVLVVLGSIAFWSFFTASGKNFWANFTANKKPKPKTKSKSKSKAKKK